MYYTVFTVLVWLLLGAPFAFTSFGPIIAAFILAIILDLLGHGKFLPNWNRNA